ncbi:1-aminocyclopropane-1-carboxylate oxidase homolog 1-like isoform X1 [Dendrobium catenatum]|uniref:1-aminocyclopropane-1-carboxylate oxidase like 1 n=1 Tax=Dendrobium catenatum TaxID=906689 RepID=A0A2I0X683_9ASPA|nr:1-aminocyclopropane-1-carboxylate oxidase homolog 1-like isoform X1 [Dendrobium catenatum]PKU83425.1 1-aminocyclopropane-1-carboxylate oxidase like 1 [Dendrobium catenatum]
MATYDRKSEIKAFDDTKAGVKGLVDAGVTEIPRFFHRLPDANDGPDPTSVTHPEIPVIDLQDTAGRERVVELVRRASETFGFFQVLNHGVPQAVMDEMLEGVRRFNEQDLNVKMRYYTRDQSKTVLFNCNFDLYESPVANWRDTLFCAMAPEPAAKPEDLPEACREIIMEYTRQIQRLGHLLFELLSEGLGLDAQYLNDLECGKGLAHLSHYYPPCPEPELALGTSKHADPDFLTILLQDTIGGLQVLHQNQWIDVPPISGAFVVNIGDLLQLITNDKFKSVEHRVQTSKIGPRVSVACFFTTHFYPLERRYGPIKKLLSETNLPKYKDITVREYVTLYNSKGLNGKSSLDNFRL